MTRFLPVDDALRPGPDEARRWAEDELAKDAYGASYLQRVWDWVTDRLSDLLPSAPAGGGTPLPTALAIVGAAAIAAIVMLIVWRRRPTPAPETSTVGEGALFEGRRLLAREHRRRAEAALTRGDTCEAAVEAFRALAARVLERHLLDDLADRTAREFAAAAGGVFPPQAADLRRAGLTFDAARYGGQAPPADDVRRVLALDDALAAATPQPVEFATAAVALAERR